MNRTTCFTTSWATLRQAGFVRGGLHPSVSHAQLAQMGPVHPGLCHSGRRQRPFSAHEKASGPVNIRHTDHTLPALSHGHRPQLLRDTRRTAFLVRALGPVRVIDAYCYQTCLVIVQCYSPLTEKERAGLICCSVGVG